MSKIEHEKLDALVSELRRLCATLPGAEEYVMVHHPAFRVGKKPFVICGMQLERAATATLSVNLGREAQDALLGDARFSKTPYIGQHGWITVARTRLNQAELAELVADSWRRIAGAKRIAAHAAGGSVAKAPKAGSTERARSASAKKATQKAAPTRRRK